MPVRALRFVHAANLRLDAALSAAAAVSDELQAILDEAAANAFSHIVESAIEHDADALLITGDTFDAAAGSLSAEVTLRRELNRLNEIGLPVFITPGLLDPAKAWQEISGLPENVTVFLKGSDEGAELTDRGRRIATVLPVSSQTGVDAPELERLRTTSGSAAERGFVIGLWIPDNLANQNSMTSGFSSLNYLAAGAASALLPLTEGRVHVQAGPQGLCSDEAGCRGCQIVDVDAKGELRSQLLPLAPVRWETLLLDGRGIRDHDELCDRMLGQLDRLAGYPGEQLRIITWLVELSLLDSIGIASAREQQQFNSTLTDLTDQPKQGLRYLHRIQPQWNEQEFPPTVDRELWQDFLAEMERVAPVERDRLLKLWEQQTGNPDAPTGWPVEASWPPVNPERVRRLTLQNGRRWFRPLTGGASR